MVSLVTGILWIYWLGSLIAVIAGPIALRQINRSQGTQDGRGMAIAGIAIGAAGLSIYVTLVIAAS